MRGRETRLTDQIFAIRPSKGQQRDAVSLESLLRSEWRDEICGVYAALGGIGPPRFRFGGWDIHLGDIIIELDEEQHFNRYRTVTLSSAIYDSIPHFSSGAYRRWCSDHEEACLRKAGYGGYWNRPATDRMFGPSGPKKDLTGPGSSRWKQRAFYDFIRDVWQLTSGVPVIRLSVWEPVNGGPALLGDVLDQNIALPADWLAARINL